ncbi:pH regulation protein F [Rubrobacter taiwanensis]|uniref:pH regulation protein F n=1 Tax=Rubrobacter taiwanensis TaxID=185139 RepID=A0A4R1BPU9_9ACTN|nr:monovalent cation/H+ antiporter complex subunit F [Rubrobacter taiwanensis]TCJ19743.1 pH regulation protein F [Rubrobacter taiwanensis]
MHEIVFYVAAVWMTLLLGVSAVLVITAHSTSMRILALDMLTLILVAALVLFSDAQVTSYYLDAALILALLSFAASMAAARYYGERNLF